jgi:uncharacterized membrane protein HdeD (DUF308 family)
MKKFFINWKTTVSGIVSIAAGIVLYSKGEHTIALSTIAAGIGHIFGSDAQN